MKNLFNIFLVLAVSAALLSSCKSLVTLDDVKKQENRALNALEDAREESLKLANLKEQYSKDRIKAQIDELEKEQKDAKKDIKKLKGIATESAVGTTAGTLKTLENRSDKIDAEIKKLKSQQPENREESRREIQQDIDSLKREIQNITRNLSE